MNKKQELYDQIFTNVVDLAKTLTEFLEGMQELNRVFIEEKRDENNN